MLGEGVLLAHGLVQRVADSNEVKVFFIKGPASRIQGLQPARDSADVDVFVEPGKHRTLADALGHRGWLERPSDAETAAFPQHSVTLYHPQWPNDIDIHFSYPGMEAAVGQSFQAMWRETQDIDLAGRSVRVPSPALGICFVALHALRSPHLRKTEDDLNHLHSLDLNVHQEKIMDIATATDATGAMDPFLQRAFGAPGVVVPTALPSDAWVRRTQAVAPGSARILAVLSAPWNNKARILLRSAIPSRDGVRAANLRADVSTTGLLAIFVKRWVRLVRSAPETVREVRSFVSERRASREKW